MEPKIIQVQVEVEEKEIDGDGNVLSVTQKQHKQTPAIEYEAAAPSSYIRESSRDRFNRLNELYANPQNLSSPVHRTEPGFTLEDDNGARAGGIKLKPRTNKLNQLMESRREWVDESKKQETKRALKALERSQANAAKSSPAKTGAISKFSMQSPRRSGVGAANSMTKTNASPAKNATNKPAPTKQITFEKDYMDTLEMQGFKRRDTTHQRLEYNFSDYAKVNDRKKKNDAPAPPILKGASSKATTSASTSTKAPAPQPPVQVKSVADVAKKVVAQVVSNENKPPPSKKGDVSKSLVSGRAAIFETQQTRTAHAAAAKANQKDPAEMSLKERMALFEKNKGTAIIPKAALGIAPSLKQIMGDQKQSDAPRPVITSPQQPIITNSVTTTSQLSKISNYNRPPQAESMANGASIRQTVENLLTRKATISEAKIATETRKNRQAEMNVVMNRLNYPRNETDEELESSPVRSASPPPAPPMPGNLFNTSGRNGKRSSSK